MRVVWTVGADRRPGHVRRRLSHHRPNLRLPALRHGSHYRSAPHYCQVGRSAFHKPSIHSKRIMNSISFSLAALLCVCTTVRAQTAPGSPTVSPGFGCAAGYQWSVNTPIPSCVPSVGGTASPIPCNGGTVSWAGAPAVTCQASVGAALDSVVKAVSSTNTSTGNASFSCTNGAWVKTGASSCTAAPCAAGNMSWTANGYTCSGAASSTSPGSVASVTATGPTMGAASFTCSVTGVWGAANAGATCAPANCPGGAPTSWTSGGFVIGGGSSPTCSGGALPLGTPEQSLTLSDSTAPTTGSASFTCSNGTWVMGAKSCVETTGCSYTATAYWQHGGPVFGGGASSTCSSGPLPAGTEGQQVQLTDSVAADGATGSARYTCNGGSWRYDSSRTCGAATTPAAGCASANLGWYVGSNYCTATAAATSSGGYAFLSDSTAPTTGTGYVTCSAGSWGTPYSTTCNVAVAAPTPPAQSVCPAGRFTWSAGGQICDAHANQTSVGITVALGDTTGTTGSAYVTCNSGGNWGTPFSAVCAQQFAPPAPSGCAAIDGVVYGVGNGGIRYVMKAASSGFSTTISMMPPYVWYQPSQISGPGALYAPGGDGNAQPLYCSGQATATCSGSTWTITPIRTPGLTPQCGSTGGF